MLRTGIRDSILKTPVQEKGTLLLEIRETLCQWGTQEVRKDPVKGVQVGRDAHLSGEAKSHSGQAPQNCC